MSTGGGQGPVTAQRVVDTALRIVESGGVERLTVRRLAGELSVAVTSIYWHVGDKEALLDAVVERIVERFGNLEISGEDPAARLMTAGRNLRRMLLDQSALVALVHSRGRTAALMQPARLAVTRELVAAGLAGRELALSLHAVLDHVVGSVLLDREVQRQPAQRQTPAELWGESGVPGPAGVAAAVAAPLDPEEQFDYALHLLIKGLLGR